MPRPKSIDLLILTKFRMYPIFNVLISNLSLVFESFVPKYLNLGILGQDVATILTKFCMYSISEVLIVLILQIWTFWAKSQKVSAF